MRGMEIWNENSSCILSIIVSPTPYSLADVFLQQFLCGPNFSQKLSSSYFCSYLLVQFPEKILSKTRQRRRLAFLSRSAVILEKPGIKIVFQKNVLRAILYLNRIHGSTLSLCKVWWTKANHLQKATLATSSNLDLFRSKAQKQRSTRKLRFSFDQVFHKC